jgi:cell wall-associated NlpC family hydrolase
MKHVITLATVAFTLALSTLMSCQQEKEKVTEQSLSPTKPKATEDRLMEGDILFQISTSGQGKAIQLATNSQYSHCGILFKENNQWMVYEGVQPVKTTKLSEWVNRGEGHHYVSKRHKDAASLLTKHVKEKMKEEAKKLLGKNYDLTFEWNDDRIYCSELVYKIYQRGAGISIGTLQKLQDFNLNSPVVRAKLNERYGKNIPLNETVISPGAIFADSNLVEILSE